MQAFPNGQKASLSNNQGHRTVSIKSSRTKKREKVNKQQGNMSINYYFFWEKFPLRELEFRLIVMCHFKGHLMAITSIV